MEGELGDLQVQTCGILHRSIRTAEAHALRRGYTTGQFVVKKLANGTLAFFECVTFSDDAAMAQSLAAGRILTAEER
jgi:hypothetical protein